eukprot:5328052-Amphidinium_carterae.3
MSGKTFANCKYLRVFNPACESASRRRPCGCNGLVQGLPVGKAVVPQGELPPRDGIALSPIRAQH